MNHSDKIDNIFSFLRILIIIPGLYYCLNIEGKENAALFWIIFIIYVAYSLNIIFFIRFNKSLRNIIYKITGYIDIVLLLVILYFDILPKLVFFDAILLIVTIHSLYFGLKFALLLLTLSSVGYFLILRGLLFQSDLLTLSVHLSISLLVPIIVGYLSDLNKKMTRTITGLNQDLLKKNTHKEELLEKFKEKNTTLNSLYNFSQTIARSVDIRVLFEEVLKFIKSRLYPAGEVFLIKKEEEQNLSQKWHFAIESGDLKQGQNFSCFGINLIGKLAESQNPINLTEQKEIVDNLCIFSYEGLRYKCSSMCIFKHGKDSDLTNVEKLVLPIIVNQNVYGALIIFYDFKPENRAGEINFYKTILNHLSSAMERAMAFRKLKKSSEIDVLTGVYNRSKLTELATGHFNQAALKKKSLSFIFVDLDHFKKINDQFGHQTGDLVLYEVAQMMESSIRSRDICGRYGGEEFVIILPNVKKKTAKRIANKLRQKAEDIFIHKNNSQFNFNLTISCGISSFPEDGKTLEQTLGYADEALYQAKKTGRNRVVCRGDY